MARTNGTVNGGLSCGCRFEKKTKTREYERWCASCEEHAEEFAKVTKERQAKKVV